MKPGYQHTVYAAYLGYITQAIVNNLAPLLFLIFRDSLGIPLSQVTLLITVNFGVQLTVDLLSAKIVDKIGYRRCIVAAHLLAAAGLIAMALLPSVLPHPFAGLLLASLLYAVGGGIIEVLISPIVEACPTDNKAAAMSLLHSFYCWGTVGVIAISTVLLHLIGKAHWQVLPLLWAVLPLCNAFFFTKVPINTLTEEGKSTPPRSLLKNKYFWIFIVLMVAAGASEQAMSQWASAFAESGLGISKTAGDLAGPCLFSVLMGIARVVSARCSEKIHVSVLLSGSAVLCIGAYLLAALCANPVLALCGCALCGFSVGCMWPGTFSLASERFPQGGTGLFALLALAGDLGCMGGPTLVGEIAGAHGDRLSAGLLPALLFPVLMLLFSLPMRRSKSGRL